MNLRTIQRDLAFLRQAGLIRTKYDQSLKGYLSLPTNGVSVQFPTNKAQRRYMERIIRIANLIDLMQCSYDEDLIGFYREYYPNISERTRQRDFDLLREIGFTLDYVHDDGIESGYWYYECIGAEGPYHKENI